jgi:hypothetical protein
MKRYAKAVLGGFLAILAAIGWTVAIAFLALLKGRDTIVGIEINKWPESLILMLLVFSAGFYLAFRAAYSKNSN